MKKLIYILAISFLISHETINQEFPDNQIPGYFLYKLYIDASNNITLDNLKFVDKKLKQSQLDKHIHYTIIYKIKNVNEEILYESKFSNPKYIHYEDILNQNPSKTVFELNSTFFIIKTPAFNDAAKIEFYELITENNNEILFKIREIILDVK